MTSTSKRSKHKYYLANKQKQIKRQRQWRKNNPAEYKKRVRKYHLKAKYGITEEEYIALFKKQNRRCAICKSSSPNHFRGWNIDHCHKTGRVRGVLCHHCNLLLGNAKDSANILQAAQSYLRT
jgi:Autographiviridae endonuclease VII